MTCFVFVFVCVFILLCFLLESKKILFLELVTSELHMVKTKKAFYLYHGQSFKGRLPPILEAEVMVAVGARRYLGEGATRGGDPPPPYNLFQKCFFYMAD